MPYYHKSIYFYFTQNNTFSYPIFTFKRKKGQRLLEGHKPRTEKIPDNEERKKEKKIKLSKNQTPDRMLEDLNQGQADSNLSIVCCLKFIMTSSSYQ